MNRDASISPGAVLITGVSSGIGAGMTRRFLQEGFQVFGSVRTEEQAAIAANKFGANFEPLVFDVCHEAQVESARDYVLRQLEGRQLKALINNAGMAEIGPLLHVSTGSFRRQLDVLVVGQLTVIQKFYSLLIERKSNPGAIFNVSSISGQNANPFFGCYASGKHALEGMSKTLRKELEKYGIKVVVIAPANIATELWTKQSLDLIEPYKHTDYYQILKQLTKNFTHQHPGNAMTVEEFSGAMFKIFSARALSDRYTVYKGRWGPPLFNKMTENRVRIIGK